MKSVDSEFVLKINLK